jgi:hypothetical protein
VSHMFNFAKIAIGDPEAKTRGHCVIAFRPSLVPRHVYYYRTPCLRNLHDNAAMSSFGAVFLAS